MERILQLNRIGTRPLPHIPLQTRTNPIRRGLRSRHPRRKIYEKAFSYLGFVVSQRCHRSRGRGLSGPRTSKSNTRCRRSFSLATLPPIPSLQKCRPERSPTKSHSTLRHLRNRTKRRHRDAARNNSAHHRSLFLRMQILRVPQSTQRRRQENEVPHTTEHSVPPKWRHPPTLITTTACRRQCGHHLRDPEEWQKIRHRHTMGNTPRNTLPRRPMGITSEENSHLPWNPRQHQRFCSLAPWENSSHDQQRDHQCTS